MTSIAPTCGWMPVWALMSMRATAAAGPAQERLCDLALLRREREDGPAVIRVGMEVEEARRRKRPPDRLDGARDRAPR